MASNSRVISLIGSSGSGKSTFLRCINLLEMPEQGEISLSGETIKLQSNKILPDCSASTNGTNQPNYLR